MPNAARKKEGLIAGCIGNVPGVVILTTSDPATAGEPRGKNLLFGLFRRLLAYLAWDITCAAGDSPSGARRAQGPGLLLGRSHSPNAACWWDRHSCLSGPPRGPFFPSLVGCAEHAGGMAPGQTGMSAPPRSRWAEREAVEGRPPAERGQAPPLHRVLRSIWLGPQIGRQPRRAKVHRIPNRKTGSGHHHYILTF